MRVRRWTEALHTVFGCLYIVTDILRKGFGRLNIVTDVLGEGFGQLDILADNFYTVVNIFGKHLGRFNVPIDMVCNLQVPATLIIFSSFVSMSNRKTASSTSFLPASFFRIFSVLCQQGRKVQ